MSLAAGLGSVVTKNQLILNGAIPNVIAGVGCNVVQAFSRNNSNHFEMQTGEVFNGTTYTNSVSSFTTQGSYLDKWLKVSPNGYLWALIAEKPGSGFGFYAVEIRNRFLLFDPTAYSPPLVLIAGTGLGDLFACEFSPDGTKFYVSSKSLSFKNLSKKTGPVHRGCIKIIITSCYSLGRSLALAVTFCVQAIVALCCACGMAMALACF